MRKKNSWFNPIDEWIVWTIDEKLNLHTVKWQFYAKASEASAILQRNGYPLSFPRKSAFFENKHMIPMKKPFISY